MATSNQNAVSNGHNILISFVIPSYSNISLFDSKHHEYYSNGTRECFKQGYEIYN